MEIDIHEAFKISLTQIFKLETASQDFNDLASIIFSHCPADLRFDVAEFAEAEGRKGFFDHFLFFYSCKQARPTAEEEESINGLVYFLKDGDAIKIGFTTGTVAERIAQLSTGNASTIISLGSIPGSLGLENKMHRIFSDYWLTREWYEAAVIEPLIPFIVNIAQPDIERVQRKIELKKLVEKLTLIVLSGICG